MKRRSRHAGDAAQIRKRCLCGLPIETRELRHRRRGNESESKLIGWLVTPASYASCTLTMQCHWPAQPANWPTTEVPVLRQRGWQRQPKRHFPMLPVCCGCRADKSHLSVCAGPTLMQSRNDHSWCSAKTGVFTRGPKSRVVIQFSSSLQNGRAKSVAILHAFETDTSTLPLCVCLSVSLL